MSTDSGDSERGGVARLNAVTQVLLAVAAVGATVAAFGTLFLNYQSIRMQQALEQRVILDALPGGLHYTGSKDVYELSGIVVNEGDKIARGCKALFQGVNDQFMPRRYLVSVLESGPFWNLTPGGNHTSKGKLLLREADYGQDHIYIEFWFECTTDGAHTSSFFYKVNFRKHTVEYIERWRSDPHPVTGRPWPELLKGQGRPPCDRSGITNCALPPPSS
jgi:hypothetical protein